MAGGKVTLRESIAEMCGIAGMYSRGFGSVLVASGCGIKDNVAQGVVSSRGGHAEARNSHVASVNFSESPHHSTEHSVVSSCLPAVMVTVRRCVL